VEYVSAGETELYGRLKNGAIGGPEWVSIPTRSGPPYVAWTSGMQVTGALVSPVTADLGFSICVALQNHPNAHDILVPIVASGLGEETPPGLEHTLPKKREGSHLRCSSSSAEA
jgi:hypothetical protein